ncbi:MAG: phosphatidylglycerophosphatase A [Planctomycetota bacterium]
MTAQKPLRHISVFGLGFLRPAPGTWGSLPPAIVAFLLLASRSSPWDGGWGYHAILLVVGAWACWACIAQGDEAERQWGKDPSNAVADETAGQCIALAIPPVGVLTSATPIRAAAIYVGVAFVAFRVMDIVKPPPAYQIQRLRAGWGILLDDLVAGFYALVAVQLACHYLPAMF